VPKLVPCEGEVFGLYQFDDVVCTGQHGKEVSLSMHVTATNVCELGKKETKSWVQGQSPQGHCSAVLGVPGSTTTQHMQHGVILL